MTNRQLVARVNNQLRLLSKDSYINDRAILRTAQNTSESYLSKRARNRQLFRQDNLYNTITCVEFKEVNTYECDIVEFKTCNKLMRSKKKMPKLVYSRYGSSIKEVTSIDGSVDFKPSTISQYRRDSKRQQIGKHNFFYSENDYIWLPDSEMESGRVYLLTIDLYDLNEISECSDKCKSAWDYDFIVPSDLLEQVIRETVQQLSTTIQIVEDENPNMDSNIKSQTV